MRRFSVICFGLILSSLSGNASDLPVTSICGSVEAIKQDKRGRVKLELSQVVRTTMLNLNDSGFSFSEPITEIRLEALEPAEHLYLSELVTNALLAKKTSIRFCFAETLTLRAKPVYASAADTSDEKTRAVVLQKIAKIRTPR